MTHYQPFPEKPEIQVASSATQGKEERAELNGHENHTPSRHPGKTVTMAEDDRDPSQHSDDVEAGNATARAPTRMPRWRRTITTYFYKEFEWVPQTFVWSNIKPAIRCALVAWVSLVLFVIPKVEAVLGQAGFLILIASILSPPSDPFMAVLEREILILLLASLAWAWCCLGMFLADLARTQRVTNVTIFDVVDGKYLEAGPIVIIAVFLFLGTTFLLLLRVKQGPGPYLFATVLACLCLTINLTTGALYPFPFYLLGQAILIPLCVHTALSLVASVIVFPSTISALFTTRLTGLLNPLLSTLDGHRALLRIKSSSTEFASSFAAVRANTKKTEAAIIPLAVAKRLLTNDLIYGRFAPADFVAFQGMCRRLTGRLDGLGIFFTLVDPDRERFPGTSGAITPGGYGTASGTPRMGLSRATTREPSPERGAGVNNTEEAGIPYGHNQANSHTTPNQHEHDDEAHSTTTRGAPLSPTSTGRRGARSPRQQNLTLDTVDTGTSKHSGSHSISHAHSVPASHMHLHNIFHPTSHSHGHHSHHHHHHSALLHSSLLSLAKARAKKPEHAVGTFESQRYMNLEATKLWDPHEEQYNEKMGSLLQRSCDPLLEACSLGITIIKEWMGSVRDGRLPQLFAALGFLDLTAAHDPSARCSPIPIISPLLNFLGIGQARLDNIVQERNERIKKVKEMRKVVKEVLEAFRREERHLVLEPYQRAFEEGYSFNQSHATQPQHSHPMSPLSPKVQPEDFAADIVAESPVRPQEHRTAHSAPILPSETGDVFFGGLAADGVPEEEYERKKEYGEYGREKERHEHAMPPHRYLFNCYVYQYNLMQIASIVLEMLDEILRMEEERPTCKLWTPVQKVFNWSPWSISEGVEHLDDDDNPDVIEGLPRDLAASNALYSRGPLTNYPTSDHDLPSHMTGPAFPSHEHEDLGIPKRRDPDALPPRNVVESLLNLSYKFFLSLGSGNVIFAVKAGILTVALSLPSFIKNSAQFAYENKFLWAIFMGQLTIQRFRGDTVFGTSARIVSTFFGGIVGMVMWYISCGSGRGNAYGLAAVCAVCFPFFFYARLYWPIPPMRNIIFFVTAMLVIGYSYQDIHISVPGTPGAGWSVAWRRFVLVTAGVVAAFIASLFPPTTTIRRYQRTLLSTTSSEMGTIYCAILSFANTKHEPEVQEIISSLLAIRNKLARSATMNSNVIYEYSLRGRWPADRYKKVADLQVAISYSLSHLMSVIEHLEPAWSRAFLKRTRFMDPSFQGDVLAVISMISFSLRTGNPLPQITPCPLIDRFMLKYHGLDVIHKDAEEDYGLPRTLSVETLKNEQYLMFCVGISTAFGIINRLDRLMLAVKEIVGEQYHIHGVGTVRNPYANLRPSGAGGGIPMESRTNTVHFEPPV